MPTDDAPIHHDIERCLAIGEKLAANFIRIVLAHKWIDRGEGDKASALLEKHLAEVHATGYNVLIGEVRSLLAELHLAKGELALAQRHADESIAQVGQLPSSSYLASAYNVRYQIALRQGDADAALAFYRRYAEADKAHLNDV